MSRFAFIALVVLAGCTAPVTLRQPEPQPLRRGAGRSGVGAILSPYIVFGETYHVMPSSLGYLQAGLASWYGKKFHGRLTSNGEQFDMYQLTAAHKSLPLPSWVRVTNLDNGRKVTLRVNDRGPFHDQRLIDLSYQAAVKLGFADKGVAPVVVEALDERNDPGIVSEPVEHESFYLQVGAYSRRDGAERRQSLIKRVTEVTEFADIDVRILQSEQEDETLLHKVWLGPITTAERRDRLAGVMESRGLGTPLRVSVE
ncbi:MAG: septal ring lytic transglycosylase RlpA family protein [Gammaproteobacteria bacterium]|nr:septal ring lytic transglycosylase RlpA family protein [Gammaproteobacteria bacterium]